MGSYAAILPMAMVKSLQERTLAYGSRWLSMLAILSSVHKRIHFDDSMVAVIGLTLLFPGVWLICQSCRFWHGRALGVGEVLFGNM